MKRVTGIGGIFFKSENPKALADWYQTHLGIDFGGKVYADFPFAEKKRAGRLFPCSPLTRNISRLQKSNL